MTRPWQPASEHSGGSRVTSSRDAGMEEEEEEDKAPIFSLSKSSMDVLTVVGPPCQRDPAWTRQDLRRSSSASAHDHRHAPAPQELHAGMPQHATTTNSRLAPNLGQRAQTHSYRPGSECWRANVEHWNVCSAGGVSGESTPEAVAWRGGAIRHWGIAQEASPSSAPGSPMSRMASPPDTPSPFISPLQTPPVSPSDTYLPSLLTPPAHTHQQEDAHTPSPTSSPLPTPSSPKSPRIPEPIRTEEECFLQQTNVAASPLFTPCPSTQTLPSATPEEGVSSERISPRNCLVDMAVCKESHPDLSLSSGSSLPLGSGAGSPEDARVFSSPPSVLQVCQLELPGPPGDSHSPSGTSHCRGQRTPLVYSLSDSLLDSYSRLEVVNLRAALPALRGEAFREVGTMTSEEGTVTPPLELADASVQTLSPPGSWWHLCRRHLSYLSNSHSHSILGSPPGSRLDLSSAVGSRSNLVSPSASMFPADSPVDSPVDRPGHEEGRDNSAVWEVSTPPLHNGERRRSILKVPLAREDMGRRSSMKQVQWDEEGMTWDVYGASLDPLELSTAIQTHLNLKTSKGKDSPRAQKKKTKKHKANKAAETLSVATTAKAQRHKPLKTRDIATSIAEDENEAGLEAEGKGEREKEGDRKRTREEDACDMCKAEGEMEKEEDIEEEEDEEVYGGEGVFRRKSRSRGSGRRTKRVMRSLTRPGWCGGSSKAND